MKCIAGMATMPGRDAQRQQAIASIAGQVDELWVYYNGFDEVPEPTPRGVRCIVGLEDRGDAGKFDAIFAAEPERGTLAFTVDDDLIYPRDYTKRLARQFARLKARLGRVAVGIHAARFRQSPPRSYRGHRDVRHCLHEAKGVRSEHMLGTGTLLFEVGSLQLSAEDFENGSMADVWFALAAQRQALPLRSLPHEGPWLVAAQPMPEDTLWRRMRRGGDSVQIEALGRIEQWKLW